MILSDEQITFFDQQGYLFVNNAVPCAPDPVPNRHLGEGVRGEVSGHIRSTAFDTPLPQMSKAASFFDQQAQV